MKSAITIIIIFGLLGLWGYNAFIYFDRDASCFIRIRPSMLELSSGNIKRAIKVLKYAVPSEYERLCSHVETIDPNMSCGGFQGGCYKASKIKEISIGTANEEFLGWTAAVIAHETCHAIQFQTKGYEGLEEKECYAIGDKVLKMVIDF